MTIGKVKKKKEEESTKIEHQIQDSGTVCQYLVRNEKWRHFRSFKNGEITLNVFV